MTHCPICQVFGAPDLPSRLFFADAVANTGAELAPYATRVQAGVSLSRKRRTAEDERLYFFERGIEGLHYEGLVDGYLDDESAHEQLALLIAALESLVVIGGGNSRGAGWTKAVVTGVALNGRQLPTEEVQQIRERLKAWRNSR